MDQQSKKPSSYSDPEKMLSAIDRIDTAIQITSDVKTVLDNIVYEVLQIFQSDRAWLFYPCNPDLSSFEVAFESTTPSYPGAKSSGERVPMTKDMADYCNRALSKAGVPHIDPPPGQDMTNDIAVRFDVKSLMIMALKPQIGDAWMFGLHQCDYARTWTDDDRQLFRMIGNRITHCISNMRYLNYLKESELLFRTVFEQAQVGIAQVMPDGRFANVNFRFCDILGYSKEDMFGFTFEDITHPDDLKIDKEKIDQVIGGEIDSFEIEKRYIHKNGTPVWVLLYSNVVRDKKGNIRYAIAVVSDITERKKAEEKLRYNEERYSLALAGGNLGTWDWNIQTDEVVFDERWASMKGYSLSEITPHLKAWKNLLHPDDLPKVMEELQAHLNGKTDTYEAEFRILGKNGEWLWISDRGKVLKWDGKGNPLRACGVHLDITGEKTAEEERVKWEKQLQQNQKMESIGSLAGGIAHDFNNILFPILGFSEMMIYDFDPGSPEYENLKGIIDAGKRGKDLVRQILAIGRQSEQQPIPVQIQTVLKEVLKLIRSTIPANIHITKDIQKDCGTVQADPTQLHQIAMNLITNASHALEDDTGEIAVELTEVAVEAEDFNSENMEPGRYAVLTVSDTGSGISPDIMDKLFDPYFTTKEHGKGTGLGLSVAHGIVKGYGGAIKVYSEFGKGTSFHVYLPVINKTAEIAGTENNRPLPTGDERILVVDDEAPIIQLEEALLKKLGYEVSSRTGSIDALEKFKQNPYAFDLVLTDMSMPNMTGEKLAREMIAVRPDIPVILCTGFSERLDEKKAEDIGVKDFLMKPIVNRDIAETVRKVLDEAKI